MIAAREDTTYHKKQNVGTQYHYSMPTMIELKFTS